MANKVFKVSGVQGEKGDPADVGLTVGIVVGAAIFLLIAYIVINLLAPKGIFKAAGANLEETKTDRSYHELQEKNQNDIMLTEDIRLRF